MIIYGLLKITSGTRASQVLKGLGIFIVLAQLCELIGLSAMTWLLNTFINAGVVLLVIIFQPEIRRALERMGRGKIFDLPHNSFNAPDFGKETEEIERAILNMSKRKIGALIVFENRTGLKDVIESGSLIDAYITSELVENIFFPNSPLHDGAMIIRGNKIIAAGCFLPFKCLGG
jgi:diadenylate cyclase